MRTGAFPGPDSLDKVPKVSNRFLYGEHLSFLYTSFYTPTLPVFLCVFFLPKSQILYMLTNFLQACVGIVQICVLDLCTHPCH